jgi:hypothetical protein
MQTLMCVENRPGPQLITDKAYALDESVERVLVFAGIAAVYLCLVTTGTDRVAELVLCESFRE